MPADTGSSSGIRGTDQQVASGGAMLGRNPKLTSYPIAYGVADLLERDAIAAHDRQC